MDRSLPGGNDSRAVTPLFFSSEVVWQPRSQLKDNLRPLIDHRSEVTSSGRTPGGLSTLNWSLLQSVTNSAWKPDFFSSPRTGFSELIFSFWCSAVQKASSSCGSKVKSRSTCVEVRPNSWQGFLKSLGNPWKLEVWGWFFKRCWAKESVWNKLHTGCTQIT